MFYAYALKFEVLNIVSVICSCLTLSYLHVFFPWCKYPKGYEPILVILILFQGLVQCLGLKDTVNFLFYLMNLTTKKKVDKEYK